MANGVYNRGLYLLMTAAANLASADVRVLLVKNTYTFAKTHNFVADVIAGSLEISVASYARQTLTGKSVTEDDTNGFAYFDANDVTFAGLAAGQTIGGAVVFLHTGSDATAQVLFFYDLPDTPTSGDFVIQWATPANGGLARLRQSTS